METCEMPDRRAPAPEIDDVLKMAKRIAVVGLSTNPEKDSHMVAKYLMDAGYEVMPVNPNCEHVLGLECYPDLDAVPGEIDVVDVFRRAEALPDIVDAAIRRGAKVLWTQLGIVNNAAAEKARKAGMKVIQSKCMKVEHVRMSKSL